MKKALRRGLALVLIAAMLVPGFPTASAEAQVTEDGHVIAQPELLEQYEFPSDWSADALRFCVGNGIMKGRENGLAEKANTTRAETAALLVRILGAQSSAPDLSRFADVSEDAWYYSELAAAVELGIMKGVSEDRLAPNATITREQVFTLLSRAIGLYPEDTNEWKKFTDGRTCSKYARDAVSALAERGILTGYTDGTVRPKQPITRAELAKLLYELFTCICDSPQALPQTGNVLYRGSEPIPEGYTLDGSLVIGCGYPGAQTLTGVSVSGMLVLRPDQGCHVQLLGCSLDTLSVPAVMTVSGDAPVKWIVSSGSGSVIAVPCETFSAFADCTVAADVGTLCCNAEGITVTLEASAEKCLLNAKNITLTGSGKAQTVEFYRSGCEVLVDYETLTDCSMENPDNALEIVETLVVWDTVTKDTYLYSNSDLTGVICFLPAGTVLEHYYYRKDTVSASVYTEDGTFGWVDIHCIQIPQETDIRDEPYSDEVMEAFVNQKGYSSSTKYLIWVNLKTQTVNVFTGSKGNWTLERSMPCASGKNSTPTVRGEFTVKNHYWEWDFGSYKVRYVTVFYEGYAFHSRIYSTDYSRLLDDTISIPASDGCLRMLDDDCYFIFNSIPNNTRVVVF